MNVDRATQPLRELTLSLGRLQPLDINRAADVARLEQDGGGIGCLEDLEPRHLVIVALERNMARLALDKIGKAGARIHRFALRKVDEDRRHVGGFTTKINSVYDVGAVLSRGK